MKTNVSPRIPLLSRPLAAMAAGSFFLLSSLASHADVVLLGNVGPRTIDDNVVMARNTTCVLNGATITGNQVGGNLQSKDNTPAPVVRTNIVEGSTELE